MALIKYTTALVFAALALVSCSNNQSLQSFLVDKQKDERYVKLDLAASLLQGDNADFTEEQKEILKTIRKVNVLAYPVKGENAAGYESEMAALKSIIDQDQYKTLMKAGNNQTGMSLKYLGEEDAIDEVIVFISDQEKGFAVFRLLGEAMRPDQMIKLMNSIDNGDVDVTQLSGIGELFSDI